MFDLELKQREFGLIFNLAYSLKLLGCSTDYVEWCLFVFTAVLCSAILQWNTGIRKTRQTRFPKICREVIWQHCHQLLILAIFFCARWPADFSLCQGAFRTWMGCASYSEEHVLRATHQPLIKLFAMYSLGGRWGLNSNLLEGCFVSSIAYSGALLVSLSGVTVGTIFGSMWIPRPICFFCFCSRREISCMESCYDILWVWSGSQCVDAAKSNTVFNWAFPWRA